jgi:hypothetical protein
MTADWWPAASNEAQPPSKKAATEEQRRPARMLISFRGRNILLLALNDGLTARS